MTTRRRLLVRVPLAVMALAGAAVVLWAVARHHAKVTGGVLVVAKLDRLSRSVAFLSALQDSGARFIAADMPEATEMTIHIYAAIAQNERKVTGERTRAALAAAKARGTRLGNPNGAAPLRRISCSPSRVR